MNNREFIDSLSEKVKKRFAYYFPYEQRDEVELKLGLNNS